LQVVTSRVGLARHEVLAGCSHNALFSHAEPILVALRDMVRC
jgi:hypothetical protein